MNSLYLVNLWSSLALLAICLPLYILSVMKQPGFITPVYDFAKVVENAIDIDLHLDNLCTYCETIKSDISVHCTICNRCVENYDHHCQFINNCIGYRNQKYFISFICLYTLFLMLVLAETLHHLIQVAKVEGIKCLTDEILCTVSIILIALQLILLV